MKNYKFIYLFNFTVPNTLIDTAVIAYPKNTPNGTPIYNIANQIVFFDFPNLSTHTGKYTHGKTFRIYVNLIFLLF